MHVCEAYAVICHPLSHHYDHQARLASSRAHSIVAMSAIPEGCHPEYAAECGDPSRTKRLGFGQRPALLLLDLCEAYFDPQSPLYISPEVTAGVVATIEQLLAAVRSTKKSMGGWGSNSSTRAVSDDGDDDIPVIYAQTAFTHPSVRDAGLQALKTPLAASSLLLQHGYNDEEDAKQGSLARFPGTRHPSLRPRLIDTVLLKKYPSPFLGTNLTSQLAALGADTLIIAGFTTSLNVRSAALDAMQSGFRPIVVAGACGDGRGSDTHWANLMDINAKYGDVVTVEDAVAALKKGWTT